ncbi:hypothetical protein [Gracilibacillus boraciitolerans]|nr:hypothetical protein [Gracilibacillus boraciitolerans]
MKNFILYSNLLQPQEIEELYPLTQDDGDVWLLRKLGTEQLLSDREDC